MTRELIGFVVDKNGAFKEENTTHFPEALERLQSNLRKSSNSSLPSCLDLKVYLCYNTFIIASLPSINDRLFHVVKSWWQAEFPKRMPCILRAKTDTELTVYCPNINLRDFKSAREKDLLLAFLKLGLHVSCLALAVYIFFTGFYVHYNEYLRNQLGLSYTNLVNSVN